jgi:hypothetical protein
MNNRDQEEEEKFIFNPFAGNFQVNRQDPNPNREDQDFFRLQNIFAPNNQEAEVDAFSIRRIGPIESSS